MTYIALARKYRPNTFLDVLGQDATLTALKNSLNSNKLHHAYLFTGTRGVGKTTIARLFAKSLCCLDGISVTACCKCVNCVSIEQGNHPDVIEIDAASKTKVEQTKEVLDNISYAPTTSRFKIYIIDEVHMLSNHSFNALLKTLEEPPEHVKFLLATTEQQKIPVTILSRCLQFNLRKFSVEQLTKRLTHILDKENIPYEVDAVKRVSISATGSLRDGLSLLEQVIAFNNANVTLDSVHQLIGLTSEEKLFALIESINNKDADKSLHIINELNVAGVSFANALMQLQTLLHNLSIAQMAPNLLNDELFVKEDLLKLAGELTPEQIQLFYQIALNGQKDLPYVVDEKLGFEMIVLRMLAFQPVKFGPNLEQSETPKQSYVKNQVKDQVQNQNYARNQEQVQNKNYAQNQIIAQARSQIQNKPMSINKSKNQIQISKSPIPANKTVPASTIETTITASNNPSGINKTSIINWNEIVPKLNLVGVAKILAMNSTLVEWRESVISINLTENQKPLLNDKNKSKIQQALRNYLNNNNLILNVIVGESKAHTPFEKKAQEENKILNEKIQKVKADPVLKTLTEEFNASIENVFYDS